MLGHPSLSTLKVLSGTSLERQIRTSAGRQIGTSPGWSNRILRGRPGEVEGGRPWDVLGTNMCLEISFILQLWHHNIIAVVKRKIRASFEPLASKKAALWELTVSQSNDKLLWKVLSSSCHHAIKNIHPRKQCQLNSQWRKEFLQLLLLGFVGQFFWDKVKKRMVYFGLFESSLLSRDETTK